MQLRNLRKLSCSDSCWVNLTAIGGCGDVDTFGSIDIIMQQGMKHCKHSTSFLLKWFSERYVAYADDDI
eukprot:1328916-Amorphochlora_amoeboformis.AAC.1